MGHSDCMRLALIEAAKAAEAGEVPVGAVVIRNGSVLASAHNEVELRGDSTAHAELLAIQRAQSALGNWRLDGCTLYVTLEPCPMCAGAVLNSRIDSLVFGAFDFELGCCGSRTDLTDGVLPRTVKTVGGVLETECAALLGEFFRKRRAQ